MIIEFWNLFVICCLFYYQINLAFFCKKAFKHKDTMLKVKKKKRKKSLRHQN